MTGLAPLEGVRVVELAGWMAAPGAAAVLADLGADVVKVEPLRGDPVRGVLRQPERAEGEVPLDAGYQMDNRGKRGIAVAINTPQGQDLVRQLVAGADVFVNNLLGRRQEKYGLDAASLHAVNPRLVHATMTGYGLEGPDAHRPGYDITAFFGRGGITHSITEPGSQAPRARPAQGDHAAALALTTSVLAALRLVERTGEGQVIDASLLATAAWTMSTDLSVDARRRQRPADPRAQAQVARAAGELPHRRRPLGAAVHARAALVAPVLRGRRAAGVGAGAALRERRAAPRAHAGDRRPARRAVRRAHAGRVGRAARRARLHLGAGRDGVGVRVRPARPRGGAVPGGRAPGRRAASGPWPRRCASAGADIGPRGAAPDLGQHTAEVLGELGLSREQVEALAADGVVGLGP